jgi:hypothetical protein
MADKRDLRYFGATGILMMVLVWSLFSCQKDDEITTQSSHKLEFSVDTVLFDTVFTTIGSTTRSLKVFNRHDQKISISSIQLAEGMQSQYQMNVNGEPAVSITNVEIPANDSIFIFIRVTVDPTSQNSPLIVSDSIVFETNGNIQDVNLVAWGQDAHFIVGDTYLEGLSSKYKIIAAEGESVSWEDDKPYVVYGWAVVDSTGMLNIGPGCNIHFHQNSGLWIYRGGSIKVNGEKDSVVTFQGDRLDLSYQDLPGQWDRIWINEGSVNNEFNYAVIKNGFIGIQAETTQSDMGNVLVLNNTIIQNMELYGLFSIAYRILSANCVYGNCGENTIFIAAGGEYDFRHCTFANYWSRTIRQDPSFILSNNLIRFDATGNQILILGDLNTYFGNCIVYGINSEEMLYSEDEQAAFNYTFENSILKTEMDISFPINYINCLQNEDPLFVDYSNHNFRIDTLSPAIDSGNLEVVTNSIINVEVDPDGNSRISDQGPDIGAYEFIPQDN